ncbi:phage tail protein [Pectobacterium polonicum]|nr:phage tail protein [Pectobacterium polonicum]MDC9818571.1 phage tail protein [Pectobacterium polonicum]
MSGNTQSITGTKRFTVPPVFVGESYSAGFDTENTQITENTVGRWLQFRNNGAGSARFYIRAGANGKPTPSNERIVDLPVAASGSILVTGNNAVADANGLWIVPGSAGSVSINDLTGIPLPFPGAVAPTGWLKCNGQSFSKTLYPILASRYPSGVLPDLRGEFVRGWDDGRGADAGRALLSVQGDAIRSHKHSITMSHEPAGTKDSSGFPATDGSEPFIVHSETNPDGSVSDTTGKGNPLHSFGGNETRPRNIAFNYIVRAA